MKHKNKFYRLTLTTNYVKGVNRFHTNKNRQQFNLKFKFIIRIGGGW